MNAILKPHDLKAFTTKIHQTKTRLVLTNGCFDLLHIGHIRYLQEAKKLGDVLLVAINSDASVRTLKGMQRPINREHDRAEMVAALRCVDYVTIFDSARVTQIIREVRPTLYVKGGDYTLQTLDPGERAALQEVGTQIQILPHIAGHSTTELIHQMTHSDKYDSPE